MTEFRRELAALLNRHSLENNSNTPDFILASFLDRTLAAFDAAVKERSTWYGGSDMPKDVDPRSDADLPTAADVRGILGDAHR